MYRLYFFFMFLFVLNGTNTYSQAICGSDPYLQEQLRNNPEFRNSLAAFEKIWEKKQDLLINSANRVVVEGTDTIYEIPIVFHIIHTGLAVGTNYNPTLNKIQLVVDYLNEVYGASYSGYPNVNNGGVNIPLRFVLAKRDPNCNPTDGINRVDINSVLSGTDLTSYLSFGVKRQSLNGISDATLKGIVQWNPGLYYNIWVVSKIDGWDGYFPGSGVVGYAQFAGFAPASDGTVIMARFNSVGESTLPHELGHAFNLYHTFQGGCLAPASNPCTTTGDFVCDTEPQSSSFGCPTGTTACGTPWSPTIKNIMAYGSCTDKRFTDLQSARIITSLVAQRGSLISSLGGVAPGPQIAYPTPISLVGCANPTTALPGTNSGVGPAYVHIADLQYYSSGYAGDGHQNYLDRTVPNCNWPAAAPAAMTIGQSYSVEIGTGSLPENVKIWIDFNNDGTFTSPAEEVFSSLGISGDAFRIHNGNTIIIPTTADTTIPLRMRIATDHYLSNIPVACGGILQFGQVEDFSVKIGAPTPTPVTLKNIKAKVASDNKSIDVIWKVAEEINMIDYEIESSLDGKLFSKIGRVLVKGSNYAYLFNDANPNLNQANYYRLKMNENNQTAKYSTIVSASIKSKNELAPEQLKIYPNPAKNLINIIAAQNGTFNVNIKNNLGQIVYTLKDMEMKKGISTSLDFKSYALPIGIYYIQLIEKSGLILNGKFVKQ